jgi:two-component system chemotaxis response regulator CheY
MWKVLIVDDSFTDRKLLSAMLKDKAVCDLAGSPNEAIEACEISLREKTPYDIILLDIDMGDKDSGIEVLKEIRNAEKAAGILLENGIPVFMVTAHKELVVEAFGMGCDDYITKPVNAKTLIEKITARIKKRDE